MLETSNKPLPEMAFDFSGYPHFNWANYIKLSYLPELNSSAIKGNDSPIKKPMILQGGAP